MIVLMKQKHVLQFANPHLFVSKMNTLTLAKSDEISTPRS